MKWWTSQFRYIEIEVEKTVPKVDLAIAYSASDGRIGFTLTVDGKPQQFEMTRGAAASFVGRLVEALK